MHQRAIHILAKAPAAAMRATRSGIIPPRNLIRIGGSLPALPVGLPPVFPMVSALSTSTATTAAAGTAAAKRTTGAGGLTDLLEGEEEDTTRFKVGQPHDRGPTGQSTGIASTDKDGHEAGLNIQQTTTKGQTTTTSATSTTTNKKNNNNNNNYNNNTRNNNNNNKNNSNSNKNEDRRPQSRNPSSSSSQQGNRRSDDRTAAATTTGSSRTGPNSSGSSSASRESSSSSSSPSDSPRQTQQRGQSDSMSSLLDRKSSSGEDFGSVDFGSGRGGGSGASSSSFSSSGTGSGKSIDSQDPRAVAFASSINAKPYTGPLMDAVLTQSGRVLPLDDNDALQLQTLQAQGTQKLSSSSSVDGSTSSSIQLLAKSKHDLDADIAHARSVAIEDVVMKRTLRAAYSSRELDAFVAAIELQYGRGTVDTSGMGTSGQGAGLEGASLNLASRRSDDYRPGQDPLVDRAVLPFNASAVTLASNLTWNASPGTKRIDAKVTLTARVSSLGLDGVTSQYLRVIAGPRYTASTDVLRMSSAHHADSSSNKREVIERLCALIASSKQIGATYGPMVVVKSKPKYSHTG